eukprot:3146887-Prymnesium_polylepis.1
MYQNSPLSATLSTVSESIALCLRFGEVRVDRLVDPTNRPVSYLCENLLATFMFDHYYSVSSHTNMGQLGAHVLR